jgi:hypothetical protein
MSWKRNADHSYEWKVEEKFANTYITKDAARKSLALLVKKLGINPVDISYVITVCENRDGRTNYAPVVVNAPTGYGVELASRGICVVS